MRESKGRKIGESKIIRKLKSVFTQVFFVIFVQSPYETGARNGSRDRRELTLERQKLRQGEQA